VKPLYSENSNIAVRCTYKNSAALLLQMLCGAAAKQRKRSGRAAKHL